VADRFGQQLGNYRIISPIGHGGFADVYLSEHIYLQTQVAIKLLQMRLAAGDMEGFLKEARTIAHLLHPHIVRVLDFGIEGGTPFLVMDYAPNGTLRQRHPRGTTLPLTTITAYIKQVADALQYAHDKKLIHRDVKPENMLLGRNNEVLLSDFGIAIVAQSSRYQGTLTMGGTMAYIAPEQVQGHPRPASDQYSLGIVVYEWLSGNCPFHGSMTEIVAQHLAVPPPPLREKNPMISPDVEQVVLTALEKDPHQRFRSVQAFASALEQASQIAQFPTSISSQAPTIPDQPRQQTQTASPLTPLSQQVIASPPNKGVQAHPDQLQKTTSAPGMLDRSEPADQGISRRTALLGLAGLATVAVVGGGIAFFLHARPSTLSQPSQNPTVGSANPVVNFTSAMFGFDPQHTHFNPKEHILSPTSVSRLALYWTASTGNAIHSSPAVANGRVYIGSGDHKLYAFNASTGQTLWTASTGNGIGSSPAVANGVVYVGSDDHKLYAFDAANGHTLWTAATANRVGSPPAVANGVVYAGSWDQKLYAFNAATGQTLWTASTGAVIFSSPAVANGRVYVGSYDHKLYAFNAANGQILWTASTDYWIFSSPAVANGIVYVGSDDHKLYAFDAVTGHTLWTASTGAAIESSPAVANGRVYVGSWDQKLYAFDAANGQSLWTASTDAVIESSPAVANGVVYIGSRDYSVYAFNADTGQTLWTASTGGVVNSSPAVANGVVYVGSNDHKLYAFHLPA